MHKFSFWRWISFAAIAVAGIGMTASAGAAATAVFTKNLRLGDRGPEVRQLQVMLNASVATQIASSGAGSAGQETDYFGALTKRAVSIFQQLYAAEVLAPAGLAFPTGLVGPLTRAKLNALAGVVPAAAPPAAPTVKLPVISKIDPAEFKANQYISIQGSNFEKTVAAHFDDQAVPTNSRTPSLIVVRVPSGLTAGSHQVRVQTLAGTSESFAASVEAIPSGPVPTITSISPRSGPKGTSVTIAGANFDAVSNTVYTGYEVLTSVPSVNGTITITINPPIPQYRSPVPFTLPFYIYVGNSLGTSESELFNYKP